MNMNNGSWYYKALNVFIKCFSHNTVNFNPDLFKLHYILNMVLKNICIYDRRFYAHYAFFLLYGEVLLYLL